MVPIDTTMLMVQAVATADSPTEVQTAVASAGQGFTRDSEIKDWDSNREDLAALEATNNSSEDKLAATNSSKDKVPSKEVKDSNNTKDNSSNKTSLREVEEPSVDEGEEGS